MGISDEMNGCVFRTGRAEFKKNKEEKMSGSEQGSYLRLIHFCSTQL